MIELGLNKPRQLQKGHKIKQPKTMPNLNQGEALICSYTVLGPTYKKYVVCQTNEDIDIMANSYDPSSCQWYIVPFFLSTSKSKSAKTIV